MSDNIVRLLHLSDIHFRKKVSDGSFDLDVDLRNELELDVERLRSRLGAMTGILITGDIAFSGQPEEYATARAWLCVLSAHAGCSEYRIWTVPGNHDVDREAVRSSHMLQAWHAEIRTCDPRELDERLMRWATDPHAAPALLAPISNYNAFAQSFSCGVTVNALAWEDDLLLNDGSFLRLRGFTSVLISDNLDNDRDSKLLVGRIQFAMPREDNVEYLVMCHHPPEWLLDRDSAEDLLKRARIQLFGHKHRQRLTRIDHSLRVSAGAVHPARSEQDWQPRFNVLEIHVEESGHSRQLVAGVYPRVWSDADTCFTADVGGDRREYRFDLPQRTAQPALTTTASPDHSESSPGDAAPEPLNPLGDLVDAKRRLVYRFCELPYLARIDIARDLGLLAEDDRDATDVELNRRVLRRARERAQLGALWEAVERRYSDPSPTNPFRMS